MGGDGYGERGESDVAGFGEREGKNDGCVCVEGKEGRLHSQWENSKSGFEEKIHQNSALS